MKERPFLVALSVSLIFHFFFIVMDLDVSPAETGEYIEMPVHFTSFQKTKIKKKPLKRIQKTVPLKTGNGKGIPASYKYDELIKKYLFCLREEIEKNKYAPSGSRYYGLIGNVAIACSITGAGRFRNVKIIRSSGDALLDRTALKSIEKTDGTYKRPSWTGRKSLRVIYTIKYQYGL